MEAVSPTRMNALVKKAQIALAREGAELLKNKRDALMREFMDLMHPMVSFRQKVSSHSRDAFLSLITSKAIDGVEALRSVAMAARRDIALDVELKKIWGVEVPEVRAHDIVRGPLTRGYSPTGVSSRIDETAEKYERLLKLIIEMASVEIKFKRIAREIKKTTRRVNALEQRMIPQLSEQLKFIRSTLEEREREDVFRLKRLKKERHVE